jgi:lipopolysaccharide transport system permease protein
MNTSDSPEISDDNGSTMSTTEPFIDRALPPVESRDPDSARSIAKPLTIIEPPHGGMLLDLREVWKYRELLCILTMRDVTVRYKQTVVGAAWAILQPLATMIVFSVFFGRLVNLTEETGVIPYPIFVFAGLLPWNLFSGTLQAASSSVLHNGAVLTKVYFPRILFPLASAGVNLTNFLVSILILIGLMFWYRSVPGPAVLLLPLFTIWALLTALSVAIGLAALVISYRDVNHIVPFLAQLWLYMTPVIYPADIIPEEYRWLLAFNPMTGVIEAFRYCLIGNEPFPWLTLAASALITLTMLVISLAYFNRTEDRFADII